ncbi:hypothetical protein SAMN02745121_09092 [Nannocystis exedens]|uniref:Glycine zipper family protein n=1 Tax=Nannocystis exedens TaxID=54 RepID=A0A1I2IZ00_9BACT|nr:hypothetical protein NAEX_01479 [Nannocystis exedens]SFF47409.1 hypothetical protein SAMN02745121_09092 [Nannocystis exedens]
MPDPTRLANTPNQDSAALPLGISFGAAAGVILGGVTGDWGVWLPIGMGVGTAVGIALAAAGRSKDP